MPPLQVIYNAILCIDTSGQENAIVCIADGDGIIIAQRDILMRRVATNSLEDILLPSIADLLSECRLAQGDLSGIIVVTGPGGFTSLRIGVGTANTIGWALSVPVVGVVNRHACSLQDLIGQGIDKFKISGTFVPVMPAYGSEPHITQSGK